MSTGIHVLYPLKFSNFHLYFTSVSQDHGCLWPSHGPESLPVNKSKGALLNSPALQLEPGQVINDLHANLSSPLSSRLILVSTPIDVSKNSLRAQSTTFPPPWGTVLLQTSGTFLMCCQPLFILHSVKDILRKVVRTHQSSCSRITRVFNEQNLRGWHMSLQSVWIVSTCTTHPMLTQAGPPAFQAPQSYLTHIKTWISDPIDPV